MPVASSSESMIDTWNRDITTSQAPSSSNGTSETGDACLALRVTIRLAPREEDNVKPYAIVSCAGQRQRTNVVRRNSDSDWSCTFDMDLTNCRIRPRRRRKPRRLWSQGLVIRVYGKDRFRSAFIGQLQLPFESLFDGADSICYTDSKEQWYTLPRRQQRNGRRRGYLPLRRRPLEAKDTDDKVQVRLGLVLLGQQGRSRKDESFKLIQQLWDQLVASHQAPQSSKEPATTERSTVPLSNTFPRAAPPPNRRRFRRRRRPLSAHDPNTPIAPAATQSSKKKALRSFRRKKRREHIAKFHSNVVGITFLEISHAKDLPPERNMTRTGFDMDPFVIVSYGTSTFRTRSKRHTLNPKWNEKLFFHVRKNEAKYSLKFAVYDKDKFSANDLVAWCEMPIMDIITQSLQRYEKTSSMTDLGNTIDEDMDWHTADLQMANPKWSNKPTLTFRAKFVPYNEIRKMFWISLARTFDVEKRGTLTRLEVQSMLDTIGSTISEATLDTFWRQHHKDPDNECDEISIEDLVESLEEHMRASDSKSLATTGNNSDAGEVTPPLHETDRANVSKENQLARCSSGKLRAVDILESNKEQENEDDEEGDDEEEEDDEEEGEGEEEEEDDDDDDDGVSWSGRDTSAESDADDADESDGEEEDEDEEVEDDKDVLAEAAGVQFNGPSPVTFEEATPVVSEDDTPVDPTEEEALVLKRHLSFRSPSIDRHLNRHQPTNEKVIRIAECPICHRPNLSKRSQVDIVTHVATCAADDWTKVDRFLMGSFLTEAYAQRRWFVKLVSKVGYGKYSLGTNNANIIVQDRRTGQLIEERMSVYIRLGMRLVYKGIRTGIQSRTARRILTNMTLKQGRRFDAANSVREIPAFIKFHNIVLDEVQKPLSEFTSFNDFFYRKLQPGMRPCDSPKDPGVAVSPADCRMVAFETVDDATRLWIKGAEFSLKKLLAGCADDFLDGSLAVFRLAPQDYHRFHSPVEGVITDIKVVSGQYYTVNPMAIRTTLDVFGDNARVVVQMESAQFGKVAVVCIGAMLVGSIIMTAKVGDRLARTDEMGYFAFGGSTLVVIWQKNSILLDRDILDNSDKTLETLVRVGNHIGSVAT